MKLLKIIFVVFLIYFIRRFIQLYKVMKKVQAEQQQNPPKDETPHHAQQSGQKNKEAINADYRVVD